MGCNDLKFISARTGLAITKLMLTILICTSLNATAFARTFKIATEAPDGLFFMKTVRAAAALIESETEGRVKFKIYPGGVQGDDQTVLRKIKIGQLHGGMVAAGSLTRFYPDLQVYNLPLSFRSYDEVDYVRQHLDSIIAKGLKDAGIITFGLGEMGFAYIFSNAPVESVADVLKSKAWVPDSDPTVLNIIRTFGISPIPLKFADVLPGLQTGLIDAVASPPVLVVAAQWHTRVKYVTEVPFMYTYAMMMMDQKPFNKISPTDQRTVEDKLGRAFAEIGKQVRQANVAAYNALLGQRIAVVRPSEEDMLVWQSKSEVAISKVVNSGLVSSKIVALLQKHLSEFRAGVGTSGNE